MKALLLCLFGSILVIADLASAQDSGNVIPFQGQLANQAGQSLTNVSSATLVFRLYQTPVGGVAIWEEAQPNISVNAGRFGVLLGSRQALPDTSYFNSTLYLGITVDDGDSATVDVEMRPRQALVPVVSARYASNADKLDGYDWSSIMTGGNTNPSVSTIAEAKLPAGIVVPVGAVIMWWGSASSIPPNFELCDGSAPSTASATLTGLKPDLRDRFPKGAAVGVLDVKSSPIVGGSHTIADRTSGGRAITVEQMPAHGHGISDPGHSHSIPFTAPYFHVTGSGPTVGTAGSSSTTANTTGITIQNTGGGQTHDHTIPGHDNRPAFVEMFFIIRVK